MVFLLVSLQHHASDPRGIGGQGREGHQTFKASCQCLCDRTLASATEPSSFDRMSDCAIEVCMAQRQIASFFLELWVILGGEKL